MSNASDLERINELRKQIDSIDTQILDLVVQRMDKVHAIGHVKAKLQVPIVQTDRWEKLMKERASFAKSKNLNLDLTKELFELLSKYSIAAQQAILDKEAKDEK